MTQTPTQAHPDAPSHGHSHGGHTHIHEVHNDGAGEGTVMLDIGSGVGALVLYAASSEAGLEIDISPVGEDERRSHVAVLARPGAVPADPGMPDAPLVHAAVYPELAAGQWNLWHAGGTVALTVEIGDGEVTEAVWPG